MHERIDRRTALRTGAVAGVALLAGCDEAVTSTGESPTADGPGGTTARTETPVPFEQSCGGVVEPTESGESAELLHSNPSDPWEGPASTFEDISGHSLIAEGYPQAVAPPAILQTRLPDGEGPHLLAWSHDQAGRYDDAGFLADRVSGIRVDQCQYIESAWEAAHYDGRLVGLPYAGDTVALYYDRDVVESPPDTVDEMVTSMDEYHDPEEGQYGLAYPINPYYVSAFAQAGGTPIYDGEADELGITSDDVQRGLELVFDRLRPYIPDDPNRDAQRDVFTDGDAAFFVGGPGSLAELRESDVNYGVTTLPSLPGGDTPRPYMGVKLLYFMTKMDKAPEEAVAAREFAEWFTTNREWLVTKAEAAGHGPVHAELAGGDRLSADLRAFAEQLRDGYPMPQNPKMDQVWGPFGDAVVDTFDGEGSLEENLAAAEEEIRAAWAEA